MFEGGCFCGGLRYVAEGKPSVKAQCHCRACQHFSGGAPSLFMVMPIEGFRYTKGKPKTYMHPDSKRSVTREFCPDCGTHILSRRLGLEGVVIKIGTLDDPAVFGEPKLAIFTSEKQSFNSIPEGISCFETLPE